MRDIECSGSEWMHSRSEISTVMVRLLLSQSITSFSIKCEKLVKNKQTVVS